MCVWWCYRPGIFHTGSQHLGNSLVVKRSNKKMVLGGEKIKNGDHIKSKLTFILARVQLHDDTLMFHREICLKAHEHMKGNWSI